MDSMWFSIQPQKKTTVDHRIFHSSRSNGTVDIEVNALMTDIFSKWHILNCWGYIMTQRVKSGN